MLPPVFSRSQVGTHQYLSTRLLHSLDGSYSSTKRTLPLPVPCFLQWRPLPPRQALRLIYWESPGCFIEGRFPFSLRLNRYEFNSPHFQRWNSAHYFLCAFILAGSRFVPHAMRSSSWQLQMLQMCLQNGQMSVMQLAGPFSHLNLP